MLYDVEVRNIDWPSYAWSGHTTTGSKGYAIHVARDLARTNDRYVRVIDMTGTRHDYMS